MHSNLVRIEHCQWTEYAVLQLLEAFLLFSSLWRARQHTYQLVNMYMSYVMISLSNSLISGLF